MTGQIRLRWTSHQGTVLSVFDALLSSESLVDVTLACEGQYLRAHKIILSACSPYFQELLNLDSSKHPILFLKDVKYTELKALVQYMYRGEVNISQDDLSSLLAVAQALKIRGLAEVETANNSITSDTIILPEVPVMNAPIPPATATVNVPTVTSTPSPSTRLTRSFMSHQQGPSFSMPSTVSSSHSPSAPPAAKKPRNESSRLSSQFVSVPKQSEFIGYDSIRDTQSSSAAPTGSETVMIDPLGSLSPSTSSAGLHSTGYAIGGMEEPEPMHTTENEKVNFAMIKVDLTDEAEDGDNSMSRSSFSDSWRLEGDNSEILDDDDGDGEIPSGSGTNNRTVDAGGAEGGEGKGMGFCNSCCKQVPPKSINMHRLYDCPSIPPKYSCKYCGYKARRGHRITEHQRTVHSRSFAKKRMRK